MDKIPFDKSFLYLGELLIRVPFLQSIKVFLLLVFFHQGQVLHVLVVLSVEILIEVVCLLNIVKVGHIDLVRVWMEETLMAVFLLFLWFILDADFLHLFLFLLLDLQFGRIRLLFSQLFGHFFDAQLLIQLSLSPLYILSVLFDSLLSFLLCFLLSCSSFGLPCFNLAINNIKFGLVELKHSLSVLF